MNTKYKDNFEDMFKFIQTSHFTDGKISVRSGGLKITQEMATTRIKTKTLDFLVKTCYTLPILRERFR